MPGEDCQTRRPRPRRCRLALLAAAGSLVALTTAALAPPASGGVRTPEPIRVVAAGFAGLTRPGAWTPVWVEVSAPPAGIDGRVVVESTTHPGGATVGFAAPVRAGGGATVRAFILAAIYDARLPGTVHLEQGGRRVASTPIPALRPVEGVIAVLSAAPVAQDLRAARLGGLDLAYLDPELLPPAWQAYEAVRLLLVRDLDERRIDDLRRSALLHWVWTGGQVAAAPSGDATAHLRGPTVGPLLGMAQEGRIGRGRVRLVSGDPADGATLREWDLVMRSALNPKPASEAPGLGEALGSDLPVSAATQIWVAALLLTYVIGVRSVSRLASGRFPLSLAALIIYVTAASLVGLWLSGVVRRGSEGAVAAAVVEAIPRTDHGLLTLAARTVSRERGEYRLTTSSALPIRPVPPAPLLIEHGERTAVLGLRSGILIGGTAVIPAPVGGTLDARTGAVAISNRSGRRVEEAWLYRSGRVQRLPAVPAGASFVPDEGSWRPVGRFRRSDVADASLLWAFSRLEADDILRGSSAWIVGLWREPSAAVRWDGRAEPSRSVLIVPLVAP